MFSLINAAFRLRFVEVDVDMLCINKTNNGVDAVVVLHQGITAECEANRRRICQTSGFNYNGVEFFTASYKLTERPD